MRYILTRLYGFLTLLLLAATSLQAAAQIAVDVDRSPIAINESFTVTFTSNGKPDGDPDFTVLQRNFSVLSQSSSTSVQWVNGRKTEEYRWIVMLMAEKAGKQTIPPIAFGKQNSAPYPLEIVEAKQVTNSELDEMMIEAETDKVTVYQQQQVIYTIRFLRRVSVNNASISEPEALDNSDLQFYRLGEDNRYEVTRQGQRYAVIERKYALFPPKAGKLTIKPIQLDAQVVVGSRLGLQLFNQQTQYKRLHSDSVTLEVQPPAEHFSGTVWLPASTLTISEDWGGATALTAGEPITRILTIQANGLTASMLPDLPLPQIDGAKLYPDKSQYEQQLVTKGVTGTRIERLAIIPTTAGAITIPAVAIPWWDVTTNTMQTAFIPERSFRVAAAPQQQIVVDQNRQQPAIQVAPVGLSPGVTVGEHSLVFHYEELVLAVLWVATVIGWWQHVRYLQRSNRPKSKKTNQLSSAKLLQRSKKAMLSEDAIEAERAILQWASHHFGYALTNIGDLAHKLPESCREPLQQLQQSRYQRADNIWNRNDAETLLRELQRYLQTQAKAGDSKEIGLAPLYPQGPI